MKQSVRRERSARSPEDMLIGPFENQSETRVSQRGRRTDTTLRRTKPQGSAGEFAPMSDGGPDQSPVRLRALMYRSSRDGGATEPGYAVRFVPESMVDENVYDLCANEGLESNPVTAQMLDSLPGWARAKLKRDGYLKFRGQFDSADGYFTSFYLGWENQRENQADRLVEILDNMGSDEFAASVYYFINTQASERYSSPETIADIRGIKSASVMDGITRARRKLEE